MNFAFFFPPFFGFGFSTSFHRSCPRPRGKRNTLSISLLNFFLGWTLVGSVVALVWAVKVDGPASVR
jgi:Superinfection immunity protein